MATPDTRTVVRNSLIDPELASDRNLVDVQKEVLEFSLDRKLLLADVAKKIRNVFLRALSRKKKDK